MIPGTGRQPRARGIGEAVHAEDHGHELLSDNWFDLLPGVPVRVRLAHGAAVPGLLAV